MITDTILNLFFSFLVLITYPIRALPDVSLPAGVAAAATQASFYFHYVDPFLPLGPLFAVLAAVLSVEGFILLYRLVMWVIRKIPGMS